MKFPLIAALILIILPSLTSAQELTGAPRSFAELAEMIVGFLNAATGVLMVVGLVVYFWGMSINILSFENDPTKRKAYFVWGIVVLFVMVSIWGIIALLQNTLFGA